MKQEGKYNNIVCFGEVLWDMLPTGAKPGGAPLNVAVHLKKQGANPLLISRVGIDSGGDKLLHFIETAGLKTNLIQQDKQLPTSRVLVRLDENKNASYEILEPVAWDNITFAEELEDAATGADLLIYGSLASRNKTTRDTLLAMIKATSATCLVDINLRPPFDNREWIEQLLHISDFVKLNNDELEKIASLNGVSGTEEELIDWLTGYFKCSTICVTRGAKGAVLFLDNKFYSHPGYKVKVGDTVGAGDSFLARLVSSLSKDTHPGRALERACATGAFVASQKGAVPDYSEEQISLIINPRKS